jgi:succinate dehydrogenase/fumarate reductase-like Fe-S protein
MMGARLYALGVLAWALVLLFVKKIFGRGPRGLALFQANFAAEGLSRIDPQERADFASFSRCVACGRCNLGDGPRMAASRGAYPGTMALMLAASRSMPDFDMARHAFAWIRDEELGEKERLCPTGVPMRRIAAFVRAHSEPHPEAHQ